VWRAGENSPEGTAETVDFSRPFGTYFQRISIPALKRWLFSGIPPDEAVEILVALTGKSALRGSVKKNAARSHSDLVRAAFGATVHVIMIEGEKSEIYDLLPRQRFVGESSRVGAQARKNYVLRRRGPTHREGEQRPQLYGLGQCEFPLHGRFHYEANRWRRSAIAASSTNATMRAPP